MQHPTMPPPSPAGAAPIQGGQIVKGAPGARRREGGGGEGHATAEGPELLYRHDPIYTYNYKVS